MIGLIFVALSKLCRGGPRQQTNPWSTATQHDQHDHTIDWHSHLVWIIVPRRLTQAKGGRGARGGHVHERHRFDNRNRETQRGRHRKLVLVAVLRLGQRRVVRRRTAEAAQEKQFHEDQQERQRRKREARSKENVGPAYRRRHASQNGERVDCGEAGRTLRLEGF